MSIDQLLFLMKERQFGILRKLMKQKSALLSMIIIVILVFISVFGYFIATDATPYANEQHLELAFQKPGFRITFLQVPYHNQSRNSFFEKLISGEPLQCERIPLKNYWIDGDSLFVEVFTGSVPNDGAKLAFFIPFLMDTPDSGSVICNSEGYNYLVKGERIHIGRLDAIEIIEKKNISEQTFWLGTDRFGRDVLSQLIIGSRVSLSVGFVSVIIALLIGVIIGAIAGYFGGIIDKTLLWLISVFWSMPTVLLVMAITFALGKGFWQVFVAIGLTFWVDIARMVRGQVLSVREREYVEAARSLGFPKFRILFKHVLPSVTGPVIVTAASCFASAILIESGLSFLGIGVQPPMPSWGTMIKDYYGHLVLDTAYLAIVPGLAIMLLVFSFMLLGNALRDVLDVKQNLS